MKKAINISIGNTLFYIEEDAYQKLDAYLKSVRAHFSGYPDRDEIIADIESRMAEQFNARNAKIVTIEDVDALIGIMGEASEFGDEAENGPAKAAATAAPHDKRLYRNPDDAIVAGVCSGIAAYFDVDPTVVRLIFLLTLLFGGTGIILYIALWIAMPEAKTATEKLQMRGDPVTVESVSGFVKEQAEEVKSRMGTKGGDGLRRLMAVPAAVVKGIVTFFSKGVFPVLGKVVGFFVALAAVFGVIALSIAFFSILVNYPSSNIDFPLGEAVRGPLYYLVLVAGYAAAAIPAVFFLLLGVSMLRSKSLFNPRFSFPVLAIWLVAVVAFGVAAVRASALHSELVRTSPSYQIAVQDHQLANFKKVEVQNGQHVELSQGEAFSVSAEGRRRDLEHIDVSVRDGTLVVERREDMRVCIFCFRSPVTVRVTMPDLDALTLANGSYAKTVTPFLGDSLTVELRNASRADMRLSMTDSLGVTLKNSSSAEVQGDAAALAAKLENASNLRARDLMSKSVTASLENASRADVFASETLDVDAENGSRLRYAGSPAVRERLSNGSRIEDVNRAAPATTTEAARPADPRLPSGPEAYGYYDGQDAYFYVAE